MKLEAGKIARMWSPLPLSHEYGSNPAYKAAALLFTIPFDLLIVLGVWRGGLPKSAKVFLLLPALYLTLIHAMSVGSLRYRIPANAPMAVLAGAGVAAVGRVIGRPGWKRGEE